MLDSMEAVLSYTSASDDLLRPWLKSIYIFAGLRILKICKIFEGGGKEKMRTELMDNNRWMIAYYMYVTPSYN